MAGAVSLRIASLRHPRLALLTALFLFCFSSAGFGQADEAENRRKLELLEKEIAGITAEISSDRTDRGKLQKELRKAEKTLGTLNRNIAENEALVAESEKELAKLKQEQTSFEQARNEQQARITLELRTAWQMGGQGQLKVLLNQEDPNTVARSLAYYRYFLDARSTLVDQYRSTLTNLQQVQERIDTTLAQLQEQIQTLEEQQANLTSAQESQKLAVEQLNASIDSKAARLKQKELDRKELENLLRAIEVAVEQLILPDNYQAFGSAKGNMPWPINGNASNRFGRPRNEGKMHWQGVTIPAKEGTTVTAIHHGRVVYADWLRGSGLLLILDHGDSYMSLYANNQSLLKDVGEWVTANTPISTVGNTGGQDQSALYFEIRHNGKPTDPAAWCKK